MSIFGDNPKLTSEQNSAVGLAQLAGGAAGAGVGMGAKLITNNLNENKLVAAGQQLTNDKIEAEGIWRILLQLKKGELTLEDFPEDKRAFYASKLEEFQEELSNMANNRMVERESMKELGRGKLALLPGQYAKRGPFAKPLASPFKSTRPGSGALVPLLSIAGAMGAGKALAAHYDKHNAENPSQKEVERFKRLMEATGQEE